MGLGLGDQVRQSHIRRAFGAQGGEIAGHRFQGGQGQILGRRLGEDLGDRLQPGLAGGGQHSCQGLGPGIARAGQGPKPGGMGG